jgi:8-oxo-dGTP pyrophosphatase MutT (NUDIX family)
MPKNIYFIYCQKLVILSADKKSVLLAKRQGEEDYDQTYTFIGGKMETTDKNIVSAMKREKDEEIGSKCIVKVLAEETYNVLFRKNNGDSVILPHIAGIYLTGDIELSDEYNDYAWVPLTKLEAFGPKVPNITEITNWAVKKLSQPNINVQLVEI